MRLTHLILTCCFFFVVISCRTEKNVSRQNKSFGTINTSDATVKKYERVNAEWIRINESLMKRDGLLIIKFDSLTSVLVMPDHTIRAIGYNPVIESRTQGESKLSSKDSLKLSKSDSLQATGSKKKEESGSEGNSTKEVTRKPSLIPWIGAGLAIAIVVLAVLWYFFKRK